MEDRFGAYPNFLLTKPYCLATYTDPRFAKIFYTRRPEIDYVRETVEEWVEEEVRSMADGNQPSSTQPTLSGEQGTESFWTAFDKQFLPEEENGAEPI